MVLPLDVFIPTKYYHLLIIVQLFLIFFFNNHTKARNIVDSSENQRENILFEPARVGRATEDIVLQIEAAILQGRLTPGDRLPSERELQTQFGTGRGVLREALRVLQEKDLVEVKKGARGGTFIKQADVSRASASLALFLKQKKIHPEYTIEFRESMDQAIAVLAIARGSHHDKARLVDLTFELEEAVDAPDSDMEHIGAIDRELNILLASMTGNPVFEWVVRAMQSGFSSHDYALYHNPKYSALTVKNWKATAREIAAGEPVKTATLISFHYRLLRECIEESEKNG